MGRYPAVQLGLHHRHGGTGAPGGPGRGDRLCGGRGTAIVIKAFCISGLSLNLFKFIQTVNSINLLFFYK